MLSCCFSSYLEFTRCYFSEYVFSDILSNCLLISLFHLIGEDDHKIQMSAGQMLLAGFNGLFTKLESEIDTLLVTVQLVDPIFEDGIDVYKEVQKLRVCTFEF